MKYMTSVELSCQASPAKSSVELAPQLRSSVTRPSPARDAGARAEEDLAKAAGVATSTVADFERGQRNPISANAQAMRAALERANIRFLPNGTVTGPSIPFGGASGGSGAAIRWVDVQDLAQWADRIDGAHSLPRLVAHLVRATLATAVQLRFSRARRTEFPTGRKGARRRHCSQRYSPADGTRRWRPIKLG